MCRWKSRHQPDAQAKASAARSNDDAAGLPGRRFPSLALQASVGIVVLAWLLSSVAAAQDDSAKVERYLSRLGLSELRVRHLEREVERGAGGDQAARKLADAYAQALMDAAEDPPRFERLKQQIDKLILTTPRASTPALQVALLQAEFQRGEGLITAWMEDPRDAKALARAAEILGPLAAELETKNKELQTEADKLAETLDSLKGDEARRATEAELLRQQGLISRATYFTGWSRYYLGVARRNPAGAQTEFAAAKALFCEVLGIGDENDYADVEIASLGLESSWRARTALGLALAEQGLGRQAAAERCFGWLQHASAPAGLRDQGAFWQLQGLLNAPNLAAAATFAQKRADAISAPPTPGKNSFCIAAIRAGSAVDATSENAAAQSLVASGIRGLARLRQFETLGQLVVKHKLDEQPGMSANFYLAWLRGRSLFFAAEKTKTASDYQAAAASLSAALASPEAGRDLFAAAQCRYHLAWCRFRLEEYELAARLFHDASPVLVDGEKELAAQAAWMEFASLQKLAETKKDKKLSAAAVAVLQALQRDFPGSEQAGKAELLVARLQQDLSPEEALATLAAIKPGEPNYPSARLEIAQLQFQKWSKLKGDKSRAPAAAKDALAAVDTLLGAKGASGDQKLRACLIGLQVVLESSPVNDKRATAYLAATAPLGEALSAESPLAAEFHYRRLQLAQKSGDKSTLNQAAAWIADHAAGSPYELPALVIVARQADDSVAAADDSNRQERQQEAAEIYARLAALVGESPEAIKGVKNALAVNSRLAHYHELLGRWKEAAARLDNIVAAMPNDKKYLRRSGIAHFQAGEYALALEPWRKLLGGVENGSEEWLEAKYHQLGCLAKTDRDSAAKVWKQFKLLFPDIKSPAWKEKFAGLEKDLGK